VHPVKTVAYYGHDALVELDLVPSTEPVLTRLTGVKTSPPRAPEQDSRSTGKVRAYPGDSN
jgi:hypothetical protein